ncbi:MAG: Mini-ribonuclease 3 [Acholeplasmataceae bacterium]
MNGLALAYIGDAYYELMIRNYLIKEKKLTNVNQLHKHAVLYTSGVAQAKIMTDFIESNILSEAEIEQFKHGRNNSGPGRKNIDAKTYHLATGFEALIGYLSINEESRAQTLIKHAIHLIERGETHG